MHLNNSPDTDLKKKSKILKMAICTTALVAVGTCVASMIIFAAGSGKVCKISEDFHGKIDGIKKDIVDGGLKIIKDINETVGTISGDLKSK